MSFAFNNAGLSKKMFKVVQTSSGFLFPLLQYGAAYLRFFRFCLLVRWEGWRLVCSDHTRSMM